ncbi:MAG: hypothetical protein ABIA11_01780 [Patescibacteria group bacterium]
MSFKDFDQMAKNLANFIKQIKKGGELIIVTGEAHCKVYNNSTVDDSFQEAFKKGIRPMVVSGPIISIEIENEFGNNLLKYQKENKIDLYRPVRRSLLHYRFGETYNGNGLIVYAEYPHIPAALPVDRELFPIEDMNLWGKKLKDDFYYRKEKGFYVLSKSRDDFLLLIMDDINRILRFASHRKANLEFMNFDECKTLYEKMAA